MNNPTGAGNRQEGIVRADKIGCLILGKEYASKTFLVVKQEDGRVLLTPIAMIPKRELWLWQNPEALAAVNRGLEQSGRGEGKYLGSFAQYADEDDD